MWKTNSPGHLKNIHVFFSENSENNNGESVAKLHVSALEFLDQENWLPVERSALKPKSNHSISTCNTFSLQGITTRAQFYNCQSLKREKRYSDELNSNKNKREAETAENEVEEKQVDEEDSTHEKRHTNTVCSKETGNYRSVSTQSKHELQLTILRLAWMLQACDESVAFHTFLCRLLSGPP